MNELKERAHMNLIRSCYALSGASDIDLIGLARHSKREVVPRGKLVVECGFLSRGLFVVIDGSLRSIMHSDGKEINLRRLQAGDSFGLPSCVDATAEWASVIADRECTLLMVPRNCVTALLPEKNTVGFLMLKAMLLQVSESEHRIRTIGLKDVASRVLDILLEESTALQDGRRHIAGKIKNEDIAKMIGSSREMVNRAIQKFKADGIISYEDGGVFVFDRRTSKRT